MHLMVYHFPYFNDKYRRVKQFSCQGLQLICTKTYIHFIGVEKNNAIAMKIHFCGSNKQDTTTDTLANQYHPSLLCNHIRRIGGFMYVDSQLLIFLLTKLKLAERRMKHIGRMGAYRNVGANSKGLVIHIHYKLSRDDRYTLGVLL